MKINCMRGADAERHTIHLVLLCNRWKRCTWIVPDLLCPTWNTHAALIVGMFGNEKKVGEEKTRGQDGSSNYHRVFVQVTTLWGHLLYGRWVKCVNRLILTAVNELNLMLALVEKSSDQQKIQLESHTTASDWHESISLRITTVSLVVVLERFTLWKLNYDVFPVKGHITCNESCVQLLNCPVQSDSVG